MKHLMNVRNSILIVAVLLVQTLVFSQEQNQVAIQVITGVSEIYDPIRTRTTGTQAESDMKVSCEFTDCFENGVIQNSMLLTIEDGIPDQQYRVAIESLNYFEVFTTDSNGDVLVGLGTFEIENNTTLVCIEEIASGYQVCQALAKELCTFESSLIVQSTCDYHTGQSKVNLKLYGLPLGFYQFSLQNGDVFDMQTNEQGIIEVNFFIQSNNGLYITMKNYQNEDEEIVIEVAELPCQPQPVNNILSIERICNHFDNSFYYQVSLSDDNIDNYSLSSLVYSDVVWNVIEESDEEGAFFQSEAITGNPANDVIHCINQIWPLSITNKNVDGFTCVDNENLDVESTEICHVFDSTTQVEIIIYDHTQSIYFVENLTDGQEFYVSDTEGTGIIQFTTDQFKSKLGYEIRIENLFTEDVLVMENENPCGYHENLDFTMDYYCGDVISFDINHIFGNHYQITHINSGRTETITDEVDTENLDKTLFKVGEDFEAIEEVQVFTIMNTSYGLAKTISVRPWERTCEYYNDFEYTNGMECNEGIEGQNGPLFDGTFVILSEPNSVVHIEVLGPFGFSFENLFLDDNGELVILWNDWVAQEYYSLECTTIPPHPYLTPVTRIVYNGIVDCYYKADDTVIDRRTNYELTIYPSITSNEINIESEEEMNSIQIIDMNGRVVYSQNDNLVNRMEIQVAEFQQGQYFIHVNHNHGSQFGSFFKVN